MNRLEVLQGMVAQNPKDSFSRYGLAMEYANTGSLEKAVEEYNSLLFYPVQYEGEEQSLNVFYTAASPNQQLVPAAEYAIKELGSKKFYLLGTDYVFPRTANKVLKAFLLSKGVPEANIMEEYTPFHHQDYQTIVGQIKKFSAGGKACVLSTINGRTRDFNMKKQRRNIRLVNLPKGRPAVAPSATREQ